MSRRTILGNAVIKIDTAHDPLLMKVLNVSRKYYEPFSYAFIMNVNALLMLEHFQKRNKRIVNVDNGVGSVADGGPGDWKIFGKFSFNFWTKLTFHQNVFFFFWGGGAVNLFLSENFQSIWIEHLTCHFKKINMN